MSFIQHVCSVALEMRLAARTLWRNRRAYSSSVGILAIGLAISIGMFSIAHAVLLRALPFPNQDSLVVLWKTDRKAGSSVVELAYPELDDLRSAVKAFSDVALMPTTLYGYGKTIQYKSHEPLQVETTPVTDAFFKTLGVSPQYGRDFEPRDNQPGAQPVAVLSYSLWQREFAGDRSIVGQQLKLSGLAYHVIGIMGPGVDFPQGVGLWTALGSSISHVNRRARFLQAVARVGPGYSLPQAAAEVEAVFHRVQLDYPSLYSGTQGPVITPLLNYLVGSARLQLYASLGAALLLLVGSCAIVNTILLAATLSRAQEMITRLALGATHTQILVQMFTETLLIALVSSLFGSLAAWGMVRVVLNIAPPDIPRISEIGLDGTIALFAVALVLVVAAISTIGPIVVAARGSLEEGLRGDHRRSSKGRRGRLVQNTVTTCQTAITTILLIASVLLIESVRRLQTADIGFLHRDTLTVNLALNGPQYNNPGRQRLFYTQLFDRLRDNSMIVEAGAVLVRPLEGSIGWDRPYLLNSDSAARPEDWPRANFEVITPGYLEAVGTRFLLGRDFSAEDTDTSVAVAIVGRRVVASLESRGERPTDAYINVNGTWRRIVGVVADTRYRGIRTIEDDVYVPYLQSGPIPVNYLAVRGTGPEEEVLRLVRREVAQIDPSQAVARVATIGQLVDRDTARTRFNMVLIVSFGISALCLAIVGVFATVRRNVVLRAKEIGIRMAIGASRSRIIREMGSSTIGFVVLGECIGLGICALLGHWASAMLYGVAPESPRVLWFVFSLVLSVSAVGATIPAWSAAGRGPGEVLRELAE